MSTALRRALTVLFFLAAVSGWALYANLAITLAPAAAKADSTLEDMVYSYLTNEINAESGRGTFDLVYTNLNGVALANAQAIAAAKPAPIPDMNVAGAISRQTIWRAGNHALIEADFTLIARGHRTPTAYHFFLTDTDGTWKIEMIWKIEVDSKAPLVPAAAPSFAIPGFTALPSPLPSLGPSPSKLGSSPTGPSPSPSPRASVGPATSLAP